MQTNLKSKAMPYSDPAQNRTYQTELGRRKQTVGRTPKPDPTRLQVHKPTRTKLDCLAADMANNVFRTIGARNGRMDAILVQGYSDVFMDLLDRTGKYESGGAVAHVHRSEADC